MSWNSTRSSRWLEPWIRRAKHCKRVERSIRTPTRRQEKVARIVKEVVSEAVLSHLSDPRITGFVSVTRVEMAPDLRSAEVYLSILAETEAAKNKTFAAITHAGKRIQALLGRAQQVGLCVCPRSLTDPACQRSQTRAFSRYRKSSSRPPRG